jgi:hypothetical protein
MDIFKSCQSVNYYLTNNDQFSARNELIKLLEFHEKNNIEYSPLVNHLIRETGLYPYINQETALWQDRYVFNVFKVNVGKSEPVTLHREQSILLKKLINGNNIAVSAPTSFGKSFVIDAFISIKNPENVVVIVPTLALTDETRRRLYPKFSNYYKIITTPDVELSDRNILIFPQERALNYIVKLKKIDILIIDEFYKASSDFDKERSPSLIKALMEFGKIAKQKYFLAPNISKLNENPFTKDMEFLKCNFNTVFLNKHEVHKKISTGSGSKDYYFLEILKTHRGKTLIYAGTYADIDKITDLMLNNEPAVNNILLSEFSTWLQQNYQTNWSLADLIKHGTGIHNGNLHRSISQIQIKLFEEPDGLERIVSTSSIIEGVNTSAENVIVWSNKNGKSKINDFTYKNIIGRSGRMFKHFVGNAFILEEPPQTESTQLSLSFPDELIGEIDEQKFKQELTRDQIIKIIAFKEEMSDLLGEDVFYTLQRNNTLKGANSFLVKIIASEIVYNANSWHGLTYLNSENPDDWTNLLFKILKLEPSGWETTHTNFVNFVKLLSRNWILSTPQLLANLAHHNIGIDLFFKLERKVTFKLSSLIHNINEIQKVVLKDERIDVSPFACKISYAFLPRLVFHLEEYGLPRMITKKIHRSGIIDFTDDNLEIHDAIEKFNYFSPEELVSRVSGLHNFDKYIINYFYDGIKSIEHKANTPTPSLQR